MMNLELSLLRDFVRNHPLEAAQALEKIRPAHAAAVLADEPPEEAAAVLEAFVPSAAQDAINEMEAESAAALLCRIKPASAATLLRALPSRVGAGRLKAVPAPWNAPITRLMEPPGFRVDAVMGRRPLALADDFTVQEAWDYQRVHEFEGATLIFVVDRQRKLLGRMGFSSLLSAAPHRRLGTLRLAAPASVASDRHWQGLDADPVWAAHDVIAVSDAEGRLVGSLSHRALRALLTPQDDHAPPPQKPVLWSALEMTLAGYRVALEAAVSAADKALGPPKGAPGA